MISKKTLCPCGSAKKYKHCCLNHEFIHPTSGIIMPLANLLEVMYLGLQNKDLNGTGTKIRICKTYISDNIIVCEFQPHSSDSQGIKLEIGSIMGFMDGLIKGEYDADFIQNFAVKALDEENIEILYAITPKNYARSMESGDALTWITHTIFRENTPDARLAEAKPKLFQIENGLRALILYKLSIRGENWWEDTIIEEIRLATLGVYSQNHPGHTTNDGKELIQYTTLIQLGCIILNHWNSDFSSVFRGLSKTKFSSAMGSLNNIRREEAHSREISNEAIIKLRDKYELFMAAISSVLPEAVPAYLIMHWREQLQSIIERHKQPPLNPKEGIPILLAKTKTISILFEDMEIRLRAVTSPPGKEQLHNTLCEIIRQKKEAFHNMVVYVEQGKIDSFELEAHKIENLSKQIKEFQVQYLLSES